MGHPTDPLIVRRLARINEYAAEARWFKRPQLPPNRGALLRDGKAIIVTKDLQVEAWVRSSG